MIETTPMPRIAPDIIWRLLDNNAVVVSPGEGEVRVLNSVGTAVWQLLVENEDVSTIEAYLTHNYEVTQERAHGDLLSFLESLTDRGILVWEKATS
jgi:hypothetical protein